MFSNQPPAFLGVEERGPQDGKVKTWSATWIEKYEVCAYMVYLSKVEKAPRVESEAADRGSMLHDMAEQYVRGNLEGPLPKELAKHYEQPFEELRTSFTEGNVQCEDEWGLTTDWEPTGFMADDVWCRLKLDALVHESPTSARVIDYKSGRPYPMKHNAQCQLYAIAGFLYYPELEFIQTELWYIDKTPEPAVNTYTRDQAMLFLPKWEKRALALTMAEHFPPSPSQSNCKFCDHAKTKTCEYRYA